MRTRAVIRQTYAFGEPRVELYHECVLPDGQLLASITDLYKTIYGKVVDIRIASTHQWMISVTAPAPNGGTMRTIIYAETIRNDNL